MKNLLFDSNVLIHAFRNNKNTALKLEQLEIISVPAVVAGELYQGSKNKQELAIIEEYIDTYCEVLPITERISMFALKLVQLYTLSHNLLIIDALIAATAYEHDMTLVTEDTKHFGKIAEIDMWSFRQFIAE